MNKKALGLTITIIVILAVALAIGFILDIDVQGESKAQCENMTEEDCNLFTSKKTLKCQQDCIESGMEFAYYNILECYCYDFGDMKKEKIW